MIDFMNAISWPIAIILFGIVAALGGLKKPLEAISTAFGGIFKDLQEFKAELKNVEENLKQFSTSVPTSIEQLKSQIDILKTEIDQKLSEININVDDTKKRVSQEAVKQEIDFEDDTDVTGDPAKQTYMTVSDANAGIAEIIDRWASIKSKVIAKYPKMPTLDKRAYGNELVELAKSGGQNLPNLETAKSIASLHSRFKGYTRRKAYAADWLTKEMLDQYREDSEVVFSALTARKR
jgi:hypothetical protein